MMKYSLESLDGMGKLTVVRTKDCAGYKWNIRWNNGGVQPPITVRLVPKSIPKKAFILH